MSTDNAAPRITPADLEAEIASEHYFTGREGVLGMLAADGVPATAYEQANAAPAALALLTFCVLILRNGCKVVGINYGPVVPDGFDPAYGREDARRDAIRQVWPLLGFRLRDKLAREAQDRVLRADIEGYLTAAAEGSMSRNNSENLAGELLEKLRSGGSDVEVIKLPQSVRIDNMVVNGAPVDVGVLRWHVVHEEGTDIRTFEAASSFHDDGSPFYYRIKEIDDPADAFVEASDAELIHPTGIRTWPTLQQAQVALQKDHEEAIKEAQA